MVIGWTMRQANRTARAAAVLLSLAALLVATAAPAVAADSQRRWRSSRYGRKGAEVWVEAPRYVFPIGKGYKDEYDIAGGSGFGFGVMFAFSDNLALEGRLLQTAHSMAGDDSQWDVSQTLVGFRYGFRYERALQPYVAAGGSRVSLERDSVESQATEFRRLSGYGAYGTLGVDYVFSTRWVVGLRADYVRMRYTESIVGTESDTIDDAIDGSSIGLSLSVHYRVPTWW